MRLHVGMNTDAVRTYNIDVSLLSQLKNIYLSNFDFNLFIIDKPLLSDKTLPDSEIVQLEGYRKIVYSIGYDKDLPDNLDPILSKCYETSVSKHVYMKYYLLLRNIISKIKYNNDVDYKNKITCCLEHFNISSIESDDFLRILCTWWEIKNSNTKYGIKMKNNISISIEQYIASIIFSKRNTLSHVDINEIINSVSKSPCNLTKSSICSVSSYMLPPSILISMKDQLIKSPVMKNININDININDYFKDEYLKEYIILESYYNYIRTKCDVHEQKYMDMLSIILKDIIVKFFEFCGYTNYEVIINKEHYNGTGAFNILFNYIRTRFPNEKWLWNILDSDDEIQYHGYNNILKIIKTRTLVEQYNQSFIKTTKSRTGKPPAVNRGQPVKDDGEFEYYHIDCTDYENELITKRKIPIDAIVFTGKAFANNFYEGVDKSNCNFWSCLFSPIIYDVLSCRLLPMGREDMDMINTLMFEADNQNYVIKEVVRTNPKNQEDVTIRYNFKITNRLIRLNTTCSSDQYYAYRYMGASESSSYVGMSDLRKYNSSVVAYMNKHKNNQIIKSIRNVPSEIQNTRQPAYLLNDVYTYQHNINFGIPTHIEGATKLEIPKNENLLGEMHIATYTVHHKDLEPITYHMFMNGKSCDDIDYNFYSEFIYLGFSPVESRSIGIDDIDQLTIMDLQIIFNHIFENEEKINIWNNLYKTHNHSTPYSPPMQVFGSNIISCKVSILMIVPFIIMLLIVIILITCCLYESDLNHNNLMKCKYCKLFTC